MKRFLVSHIWWITLLLALGMLVAHTISADFIKVDNTSIILLVVILLSPFTTAITKIKIGEFEAEVNPEEVRKIKKEVSKQVKKADKPVGNPKAEKVIENISDLVETDPVLALAKLRIELEEILNTIYRISRKEKQTRSLSAGWLAYILGNEEVVPPDVAGSVREVASICNRAVHGEDIRQHDAEAVIEIGAILLRELSFYVNKYLLKPIESIDIDPQSLKGFWEAEYEVTSVVPLVEKPYKNVRILDQEGFDALLEGYTEYAEFIVKVEKLNDKN